MAAKLTAPSGRELYHLQFLLQAASQETVGYTLVCLILSLFILLYVTRATGSQ
jgi:hypothetical protein